MIRGNGVSDISITSLIVEGMRFGGGPDYKVDHRHPLGVGPSSPLYCCARLLRGPDAFLQSNFLTPFEADLSFSDTKRIELQDLNLDNPIKFGIALGDRVQDVEVRRVTVCGGGDGGAWCGLHSGSSETRLPLPETIAGRRPRSVRFRDCRFADCGAAGVFLEASGVTLQSCEFEGNHRDFPYNHDGGQIEIDYKSDSITVESCKVMKGISLVRGIVRGESGADTKTQLLRVVGIEAYGSRLLFKDNRIEGQSHEGIHLNGARDVRICGRRTVIAGNQLAWTQYPELQQEPRQNISVTTTESFRKRNCIAEHICMERIRCENGVIFWSDGSEPGFKIDHVVVRNCDLRGHAGSGIVICGNSDGTPVNGANWSVSGNRC